MAVLIRVLYPGAFIIREFNGNISYIIHYANVSHDLKSTNSGFRENINYK